MSARSARGFGHQSFHAERTQWEVRLHGRRVGVYFSHTEAMDNARNGAEVRKLNTPAAEARAMRTAALLFGDKQ